MTKELIKVESLSIAFGHADSINQVVTDVSFSIPERGTVALVGESGSGKTVTAISILGLHDPAQVRFPTGKILYSDRNILTQTEAELRKIRGREIAMIFQEPMSSLNPVYTIGEQLIEPLLLHQNYEREKAKKRMIELLDRTGIAEPDKRFNDYPHMLSGGQLQRVMIAMSLACNPILLIADEPTTALDVTIEAQILELLEDIRKEFNMAVLMITHDLNVVKRFAEETVVMKNGRVVEQGNTAHIFSSPRHEYTRHLLTSQPQRLVKDHENLNTPILLQASDIFCYFPVKEGFFKRTVDEIKAVDDISLVIAEAETIGIVGESGSGKSTLGKCLLRLQSCRGEIIFNGLDLKKISNREMRSVRADMQVVFQDPYSSLSPRMTIEQILTEGLSVHFSGFNRQQKLEKCIKVMQEVGLEEDMLSRYPHEFSGGQRQRIAIARVLLLEPRLIILDEPTSALDVSVQKQILNLLRELQLKYDISYLLISHDLKVIQAMAHRVWVMKEGQIVENGNAEEVFNHPQHPYTKELLKAALYVH